MDISSLQTRIAQRDYTIGIIGLGYVGLPLVLAFAGRGFRVLGFDIDARKVAQLDAGQSYIRHIPEAEIQALRAGGLFEATHDFSRAGEPDALLLCVPTPLTQHRAPDLSYVLNTAEAIAPHLRAGQLVVLESTTYPTTTERELRNALERHGLHAGEDYLLAYSPEREDPGNPTYSTSKIPKVVGGYDAASLAVADALYHAVVPQTVPVSSLRTAEAVKLTENIFRSVNIALVNELKTVFAAMDIDIWEVIAAAETKPFGYMPFYPGPGLGGHCIPIDPFYLSWKAREFGCTTRFIELAGEINTGMPRYVIGQLTEALNMRGRALKDADILLLGLAYKKNVADPRESPAFALMRLLTGQGAKVAYHDPYISPVPHMRDYPEFAGLASEPLTAERLAACDAALIVTDHDDVDYALVVAHAPLVVDTRNACAGIAAPPGRVVRA